MNDNSKGAGPKKALKVGRALLNWGPVREKKFVAKHLPPKPPSKSQALGLAKVYMLADIVRVGEGIPFVSADDYMAAKAEWDGLTYSNKEKYCFKFRSNLNLIASL